MFVLLEFYPVCECCSFLTLKLMKNCYRCGKPLTPENRSYEHIIQNSLGGITGYRDLLCVACNNYFGDTIDKELGRQLAFASDMILTTRDREKGTVRQILTSESGLRMPVTRGMMPLPKISIDVPGKDKGLTFYAHDRDDANVQIKRKKKELQKFGEFEVKETVEPSPRGKFPFFNHADAPIGKMGFGGEEYDRAIGKIMINFLATRMPGIPLPAHLLDFVLGGTKKRAVFPYHPSHYTVCPTDENTFSHILHLRGDAAEGLLYCYVELFNFEKFLAVLEIDYRGPDVQYNYCYDLLDAKEYHPSVEVNITKAHLHDLKFISHSHRKNREASLHRLERKLELLQLRQP